MKLLRWGMPGKEKAGLVDPRGVMRDLPGVIEDIGPETVGDESLSSLRQVRTGSLPAIPAGERLGPCVGDMGRIIGIGLNYADHAAESGMPIPEEPIVFSKMCSATGPSDPIIIPRGSSKTDWEVELGVIVGTRAQYVAESEALSYVAGYCVVNDVSERSYQLEHGGQWTKGKSCDSFAPVGPWLVTRDEIDNPQNLDMWLEVNGKRYQEGNTRTMVFGVAALVSYLSRFMTLNPGDLIATGTPPGVGMGQRPEPIYLRVGNVVSLAVEGLGEQRQECKEWPG